MKTKRLYVGNLHYEATEDHLIALFSQFGLVNDCEIREKGEDQKRRFGFVEFLDESSAEDAMRTLHMTKDPVFNRHLIVRRAEVKRRHYGERQI